MYSVEEHISGQTIVNLAESISTGNMGVDYGTSTGIESGNTARGVLVPTAQDVIKRINAFLGHAGHSVLLKIKHVPANKELPKVYATGLYIHKDCDLSTKGFIVSRLNTLLTKSDAIAEPERGKSVDISTEQLTEILNAMARKQSTDPLTRNGIALSR